MSEPKFNKGKRGKDKSFDFLEDEAANRPVAPKSKKPVYGARSKQAPVIQKPVPIEKLGSISESGLPSGVEPEPATRVGVPRPPPAKSSRHRPAPPRRAPRDDIDDEFAAAMKENRSPRAPRRPSTASPSAAQSGRRPSNRPASPANDRSGQSGRAPGGGASRPQARRAQPLPAGRPAPAHRGAASGGARDDIPTQPVRQTHTGVERFEPDWRDGMGNAPIRTRRSRIFRAFLLILALGLLGTGGWFVYDKGLDSLPTELPFDLPFQWPSGGETAAEVPAAEPPATTPPAAETISDPIAEPDPAAAPREPVSSPLAERFREKLATLEEHIAAGDHAAAREALSSMDRTLYGYGRPEFDAVAQRLDELEGQANAEQEAAARAAEEQAEAERQAEAARQAAERERAEAAARQAQEAETLRQAERERQAALERQAEIDRAVQAQEAAEARQSQADRDVQNEEAARQAAAERARQAAIDAQARADAQARQQAAADRAAAAQETDNLPISDADLQEVYSRFLELATAIEAGDINTVIDLTQPSGSRIQQFLQTFENTETVYTRIASMATRKAEGVIVGNLIIDRLVRADGTIVPAPSAISSIRLSSARTPDGWSAIEW